MADDDNILISEEDYKRLTALVQSAASDQIGLLEAELDRAKVLSRTEIPESVVTMDSTVEFIDEITLERKKVTLVYPERSDPEKGNISILAPVGMALLGLRVGQSIEWPMPGGHFRRLKVEAVWHNVK